jgi:hypothetical protein
VDPVEILCARNCLDDFVAVHMVQQTLLSESVLFAGYSEGFQNSRMVSVRVINRALANTGLGCDVVMCRKEKEAINPRTSEYADREIPDVDNLDPLSHAATNSSPPTFHLVSLITTTHFQGFLSAPCNFSLYSLH